ncbi:ImmA/IrrE family metallo-endopeptidase [Streptomyces sp. NPDC006641]|uniref:ImmA/IrrE family metallo-endopeptidase n=2 Tax=Streptomyces TaxID=1883 RepID=UPI00368476D6
MQSCPQERLVTTKGYLRTMAMAQAAEMVRVLEERQPGAAGRLAVDALDELRSWPTLQVRLVEEVQGDGSGCSVAGSYRDDLVPPAVVVAVAASPGRRQFTALHELGHHLQQTDEVLGEAVMAVDASEEFEDLACDAFAARILLSDDLAATHIEARGPTADGVAGLYRSSLASRAACCVRAADRLVGPGAVILCTPAGVVSFAAGRGEVRPPARGTDQSATPLLRAALPRLARNPGDIVTSNATAIEYRDGSRYESLYGQAAMCDGYVVAVLTVHDPAWRNFALPRGTGWAPSGSSSWDCETCHDSFEKIANCSTCGQPQCPAGHCSCTLRAELVCEKCFMSRHRSQFPPGNKTCRECVE